MFSLAQFVSGIRRRLAGHVELVSDGDDDLDDTTSTLLSMIEGPSIVVDDADEVVRANPAAYMLGVVRDDAIIDERVLDQVHAVRAKGGRRNVDLVTSSEPREFTQNPQHADDPSRSDDDIREARQTNWLNITVGKINERLIVVLIRDVSEMVRFSQTRDAFIDNVSEQLLKPTQAVSRLADSLEAGEPKLEQIRNEAQQVRAASDHLNHMVSDLLLLIRAREPITPSAANRISLMRQLDWAAQHLADRAERSGIQIAVDGDESLIVNGDKEQLRTAIVKLLDNAIAYSPNGSRVAMTASRDTEGDHAIIRVIDNGVGMEKGEQSRIFERFYRGANQNATTSDGIGLGLAIVKHVALTHHGSLSVWSSPGQGSTFSLVLPVAK